MKSGGIRTPERPYPSHKRDAGVMSVQEVVGDGFPQLG
jgi:hypothetical protein